MEAGDIILVKSDTFISKAISKIQGSEYTHVVMAVDKERVIEADRFILSRIVKFTPKQGQTYKVLTPKNPLTDEQKKILKERAQQLVGKSYDWIGIIKLFVQLVFKLNASKIISDTNSFWCSELVDFVYQQLNIDLVPHVSSNVVSPTDIENSPALMERKGGILV